MFRKLSYTITGGVAFPGTYLLDSQTENRSSGRVSLDVCLPLGGALHKIFGMRPTTLFLADRWLNGRASLNLWQDLFRSSQQPWGIIKDLTHLLTMHPLTLELEVAALLPRISAPIAEGGDIK